MLTNNLQYTDILKGSKLNLFVPVNTASGIQYHTIAHSTNHQLTVNTDIVDIATKDSGSYPGALAQNTTWELTADHMYSTENREAWMQLRSSGKPVQVVFSEVVNYDNGMEEGIYNNDNEAWEMTSGQGLTGPSIIAAGTALISQVQFSSQQGDQAQISVSLRGVGELMEGEALAVEGVSGVIAVSGVPY